MAKGDTGVGAMVDGKVVKVSPEAGGDKKEKGVVPYEKIDSSLNNLLAMSQRVSLKALQAMERMLDKPEIAGDLDSLTHIYDRSKDFTLGLQNSVTSLVNSLKDKNGKFQPISANLLTDTETAVGVAVDAATGVSGKGRGSRLGALVNGSK